MINRLASDESYMVRYNAVYYGLVPIQEKSSAIIDRLIEVAVTDRDTQLNEQIAKSLENQRDETVRILDQKLKTDNPIPYFEIYELLAGKKPEATDRLLDMPCSRPVMFVFNREGDDSGNFRAGIEAELKAIGLKNPELSDWQEGDHYAVMLKVYVTRDRIAIEEAFDDHKEFPAPRIWWLTPEMEVQFEEWSNK